tara:strand:+ start:224 stop:466 length:243 start_codon:yes stop_codon:yes gene_type:complete
MVGCLMSKRIFHNDIISDQDLKFKKKPQSFNKKKISNVDINKLLNRVRLNEKNEKKEKFVFLGMGIFVVGLMGTLIIFVN